MSQPVSPAAWEQAGTYTAQMDRQYRVTSMFLKDAADASKAKGGLLPDVDTRRAAGSVSTWTVTITPYRAIVPNLQASNAGDYQVVATANDTVTVGASSPTLNRIDLIAIRVRDAAFSGANNDAELVAIAGTPTAGAASAPAIPAGASYLVLYEANVLAASSAATLTDRRRTTAAPGTVPLIFAHEVSFAGSFPGEMQLVPSISSSPPYIRLWDGSAWQAYSPKPVIDKFGSSGTWTKRAGLKYVRARVQAGGGAGGGCATTGSGEGAAGGGGGGGGYAEIILAASSLSATETVTVGAGGTGVTNGTGNSGGNSSYGAHAVTVGGLGGNAGTAASAVSVTEGGQGGTASAGDLQSGGQAGSIGVRNVTTNRGGTGGAAVLGGGGGPIANSAGQAGRNYGAGGGGASNNASNTQRAGGAGGPGLIIVENYF